MKKEKKPIIITENRDFKGIWIPKRLYMSREFNPKEKFVLLEIYSLSNSKDKKCYAGNEHFANFVGLSTSSIQKMLSNFELKGYIKREYEYKENTKEISKRWIILQEKFYDDFINEKINLEEECKQQEEIGSGKNSTLPMEESLPCGGEYSTGAVEKNQYISNTLYSLV